MFSDNGHVCFGGIVRPGIILWLCGIDLLPRGCHFLDFPTRKQSWKKSKSRRGKTLSVGSVSVFCSWHFEYLSVLSLCCFRDSYLSRCCYSCELSGVPGDVIFATVFDFFILCVEGRTFEFYWQYNVSAWFPRFGASWKSLKTRKTASGKFFFAACKNACSTVFLSISRWFLGSHKVFCWWIFELRQRSENKTWERDDRPQG